MRISFHNRGEGHNFWQNYTDLMSGLMIIFLIASLGYVVTKDKGRKIDAIYEAQKELTKDPKGPFKYNEKFQRLECKIKPVFYSNTARLKNPSQNKELINAGRILRKFISKQKNKYSDSGIEFEILIEGSVAYDKSTQNNYVLSYKRALYLYNLWEKNKLFNNKTDHIHFAGIGAGGNTNSDKTFIIQIIPYVKNTK